MKKGQFVGTPIFYILAAIIILFILVFAYMQINKIMGFSKQGQLTAFTVNLESSLKKYASGKYGGKGTIKEETFSLPDDVKEVCFVDRDKEISLSINNELNNYISRFNESNFFMKPFNDFAPYDIDYFSLDDEINPLCVKVVSNKIKLRLVNVGRGKTKIEAQEAKDMAVECTTKLSHGEDKLDIVFLPFGYEDKEDFSADVDYYIDNVFMKVEPFKTKIKKLNFHMVNVFVDLGCSLGSSIRCNELKVKQLASHCPNDYIIVLAERNKISDLFNPVRSSASSNVAKINTADNRLVLAHEFAHILAGLADEYVDEAHYRGTFFDEEEYANCDIEGCSEWSNIYGTGCYKGCSLGFLYRPTEESIMRSFRTSLFGPVNRKEIVTAINAYR